MQKRIHLKSLEIAEVYLQQLKKSQETLGTIHTLGALHAGHGALIKQSSLENENTIVSIYPNKIQLIPGARYVYNLKEDVEFAFENGATAVISSTDEEMFPLGYNTYIDQGVSQLKLAGSILPENTIRGMITGCIRWINFTQPNKSYFGMKDIEQSVLVKRAVTDLLIKCEVVLVPCVRFKNGVPISSRLMGLSDTLIVDVITLYRIITEAREMIYHGELKSKIIINYITKELQIRLRSFTILIANISSGTDFMELENITLPFVIRVGISYQNLKHFDGQLISSLNELKNGNSVIWLD